MWRMVDMETLNNSTLLKLNKEEMECPVCHSGKMKPLNLMYEVNHYFVCVNCGERLIMEPNVTVD